VALGVGAGTFEDIECKVSPVGTFAGAAGSGDVGLVGVAAVREGGPVSCPTFGDVVDEQGSEPVAVLRDAGGVGVLDAEVVGKAALGEGVEMTGAESHAVQDVGLENRVRVGRLGGKLPEKLGVVDGFSLGPGLLWARALKAVFVSGGKAR
jgi:hypothetical protein